MYLPIINQHALLDHPVAICELIDAALPLMRHMSVKVCT